MSVNRWKVTDDIRDKYTNVLKKYFEMVEKLTTEQVLNMSREDLCLDFTDLSINPSQLEELLIELGYEEVDSENNGWQMDFCITMRCIDTKAFHSNCKYLFIIGCGMTFELKLSIK